MADGGWRDEGGAIHSQREPKDRKVRKGRQVTNEYRAWGESKSRLRNTTLPGSPASAVANDSGVESVETGCRGKFTGLGKDYLADWALCQRNQTISSRNARRLA